MKEKFVDPFNFKLDWKRWDDPEEQETFEGDPTESVFRSLLRKDPDE